MNYSQQTPVQKAVIPLFLNYKDVVVEAVTGSGKTLAFVLPLLQMLIRRFNDGRPLSKNQVGTVIISPTRELATQIYSTILSFLDLINVSTDYNFTSALYIGGNNIFEDLKAFADNGAHIVIGTPGRLDDLFNRNSIFNLKEVEVLILDEADRLLDLGFERQLTSIIKKIPKQRRTGLFSATMNEALSELVRTGLRNPVRVNVKVQIQNGTEITEQSIPSTLEVFYLLSEPDDKLINLLRILKSNPDAKFIVYFSTGCAVDYYFKILTMYEPVNSLKFYSIHGKMVPKRRNAVYSNFQSSPSGTVLLCTDLIARGLDMPDIDWVVQFDPPQDPKAFAHRCGRTARIGRNGKAVVFLMPSEDAYVEFLKIRNIPIVPLSLKNEDEHGTDMPTKEELIQWQKECSKSDRDVFEKSVKGFVSWVRSYKEHEANYIFQIKNVNLGKLALLMGIIRMPKMPEITRGEPVEFANEEIDNKEREAARVTKKTKVVHRKRKTEPWSKSKKAKAVKKERRIKKERRKMAKENSQ